MANDGNVTECGLTGYSCLGKKRRGDGSINVNRCPAFCCGATQNRKAPHLDLTTEKDIKVPIIRPTRLPPPPLKRVSNWLERRAGVVDTFMSGRPSYLRGRQEVSIPEPPSIAARRKSSNATSLQLQAALPHTAANDPKARAYGALYQTPSPIQTFAAGKNSDYFRTSHTGTGGGPSMGTISPNVALAPHPRNRSSLYGQPPTPNITQHVPAWNLREEPRSRGGSLSVKGPEQVGDTNDDPLHILDTLPIQNLRLNPNASASDSRCGTLKRPHPVTEERRTSSWPSHVVLDASTSGLATRRLANAQGTLHGPLHGEDQSRPITVKLRPVEPVPNATRPPELGKSSRSPSQLNHPSAADRLT